MSATEPLDGSRSRGGVLKSGGRMGLGVGMSNGRKLERSSGGVLKSGGRIGLGVGISNGGKLESSSGTAAPGVTGSAPSLEAGACCVTVDGVETPLNSAPSGYRRARTCCDLGTLGRFSNSESSRSFARKRLIVLSSPLLMEDLEGVETPLNAEPSGYWRARTCRERGTGGEASNSASSLSFARKLLIRRSRSSPPEALDTSDMSCIRCSRATSSLPRSPSSRDKLAIRRCADRGVRGSGTLRRPRVSCVSSATSLFLDFALSRSVSAGSSRLDMAQRTDRKK